MKHIGFNILAGEQTGGGYFVQVNENTHYFDKDCRLPENERIIWAIMEEMNFEPAEFYFDY